MPQKCLTVLTLLFLGMLTAQDPAPGRVAGELAVTPTGAATYMVPLVLPPGVGAAVPTLALTYNSQAADGIAGWGWNLAGLSTIARVGATLHHDGVVDPVDFDPLDRFALDGQRLLLKDPKQTYGADGTEYQTENYSNLKIVAHGQSTTFGNKAPAYFVVYYPDGSRAWYGSGSSKGFLEWAIDRWVDPHGNRVDYDYSQQGGVLRIKTITYGAQNKSEHPNTIAFSYIEKKQTSTNYIAGQLFYRKALLKKISIQSHGKAYRHYELTHDTNASGYDRLVQVIEKNGAGDQKPVLDFDYTAHYASSGLKDVFEEIKDLVDFRKGGANRKDLFSFDPDKHQLIPGDFNGDGYQDMIIRDGGQYAVVYSGPQGMKFLASSQPIKLPQGEQLHSFVAGHFQDHNNHLLPQQGFISIRQKRMPKENASVSPLTATAYSKTIFTTYALNADQSVQSYSKSWDNRSYNNEYNACGESQIDLIEKDYYAADFTGDGLSDVLMIEKPYTTKSCRGSSAHSCDCTDTGRRTYGRRLFLVDMDRKKTSRFVTPLGLLTLQAEDYVQLADFDGDGRPDLWHFFKGGLRVYGLQNKTLKEITTFSNNTLFDLSKHTLLGDFNGDGKTDLMIPQRRDSYEWNLLTSTGTAFKWDYLSKTGIEYKPSVNADYPSYFWVQDVDGDGVSDVLAQHQSKGNVRLHVYQNRATEDGWRRAFERIHYSRVDGTKGKGRPLRFDVHRTTFNPIYLFITGNKVHQKVLPLNHRQDMLLSQVEHKGFTQTIAYEPMGQGKVYYGAPHLAYPMVALHTALSLPLVSKITSSGAALSTTQAFKYFGAVAHARGLGFLGFMGLARTNAYGANTPVVWQLSRHDPQLRGALTHQWQPKNSPFYQKAKAFEPPSRDFIQKTTTQYKSTIKTNGVFVASVDNVKSEDALSGFTTHVSYSYDAHQNPTRILTERDGGKTQQTFSYSNNTTATDATYHVGRVVEEKNRESWGGAHFATTTTYDAFVRGLPSEITTQGNGKETRTERFDYDSFGNLISKSLSAKGLPTRTETYSYSADGRFLEKHTDVSGRQSVFSYDALGLLQSETDPLGRTTTYGYDAWQRPAATTDYLGQTHNMTYDWLGDFLVQQTTAADGAQSQTWTDPWGRTVAQGRLGINQKWHWTSTRYDAAGRVFQASEPYSASGPVEGQSLLPRPGASMELLWTTTRYDRYGRMTAQERPNGKTLRTKYTLGQPTTTVNDGFQKVTTTLDARGNIARLEDPNGTINYTYHPNGQLATADYESHTLEVTYDQWGRKASLNDPTAGEFLYTHDAYGQLLEQSGPKGTTTYRYTDDGLIEKTTQKGDHTALSTAYSYDPKTRLPRTQTTTDNERGLNYSYSTAYDDYYRPTQRSEQNSYARFEQKLVYDALGRLHSDTRSAQLGGGAQSKVTLEHRYANNGALVALAEGNNTLWKLKEENARGQATAVGLGNGILQNHHYDPLGYLDEIEAGEALNLSLTYNKKQGVLKTRTRDGTTENFRHDKRNRLTRIQKGTQVLEQHYDHYGRLADNPKRGEYHYTANRYTLDSLVLNAGGLKYYKEHPRQDVAYNLDRKAVSIHEHGFGRADFAYNAQMQRTHAWYGGEEESLSARTFEKHYSTLFPAEITYNVQSGETSFVHFLGGDAYTAPVALINEEAHYLHRDHLGSILAITDSGGTLIEERHFEAWGEIDFFKQNGVETDFSKSILPRGFTGHEHFTEIALIHMNGRMYDPQLRRFLSPDNYVQDPYDTRSYDRFAYVWQNPLMNFDPSGEFIMTALLISGVIFGIGNLATHAMRGDVNTFWDGLKYFGQGFLAGVVNPVALSVTGGIPIVGSIIGLTTAIAKSITNTVALGSGLYHGIFKGDWSVLANAGKIFLGNFYLDENKSFFGGVWEGISRHSWQKPQTDLGYIFTQWKNAMNKVDRVDYFAGATFTTDQFGGNGGTSLGNFIHVAINGKVEGDFDSFALENPIYLHEYGHYIDSQIYGPSYLFAVGIPSAISANNVVDILGEPEDVTSHQFRIYEIRANRRAARYFARHYNLDWNRTYRQGTYETYFPRKKRN